jgi:hypothetical protein
VARSADKSPSERAGLANAGLAKMRPTHQRPAAPHMRRGPFGCYEDARPAITTINSIRILRTGLHSGHSDLVSIIGLGAITWALDAGLNFLDNAWEYHDRGERTTDGTCHFAFTSRVRRIDRSVALNDDSMMLGLRLDNR